MTRGSKRLEPNASMFDSAGTLLIDRFDWLDREGVYESLKRVLEAGGSDWSFGGAYLFAQPDLGQILYVGESQNYLTRIGAHFFGPACDGNRYRELSVFCGPASRNRCGIALLVVAPDLLPTIEPPPDYTPTIETDLPKLTGEGLEGLLLRSHMNWSGGLPALNERGDAAKAAHDHDGYRYESLRAVLFDLEDATADYPTFNIRDEADKARAHLAARVRRTVWLNQ